ncbi:MAG: hypoxanthine phosphoribosyltransferase [Oscillospiraceae bacterium]|nr:hypoxanthine phosphoribosyltransferase [Oscillospiraceae bacterium]
MEHDLESILLTGEQIQSRVRELANLIAEDYMADGGMDARGPVVVCILKGAVMFYADLIRFMPIPISIDFISISSYGSKTASSGEVSLKKDLDGKIEGRVVLIVEDIVDSGLTLSYLLRMLSARNPRSLKVAALLDKPSRRRVPFQADYIGFAIEDKFVVGYGLDFDQLYRNLPMIGVLKPECYEP